MSNPPKENILDVKDLEAPQPLTQAIARAKRLVDGEYVKMIHRMRPCHLFNLLESLGVWSADFELGEEHIIFMAKDEQTINFLKTYIKNEYGRIIS